MKPSSTSAALHTSCQVVAFSETLLGRELTMYSLPVLLLIPRKEGIFVLGQHFLLRGHLCLPSLQCRKSFSLLRESRVERRDYGVDGSQSLPLPVLLESRESPRLLPV